MPFDVAAGRFPFTAIVGQETMKAALVYNALNPEIGGVLIKGPSGTAKSTAVRSLAALLPEVAVVKDCPLRCDPEEERFQCESCRRRVGRGETLPSRLAPRPLINLPLNATEDRVAGTLDITRALREGVKALEPGLLAEANRGILYVDEINLLDDHIVDILLDAAAMGVNVIEREGISVSHPARFMLIGTMNPEEGDLRPQIADRIGLQVEVAPLEDPGLRVEVMKRREAYQEDPAAFARCYGAQEDELRQRIKEAVLRLPVVRVPDALYRAIAGMSLATEVGSHRADISLLQCAKARAALEGREEVTAEDLLAAAELALGHRVAQDPFVSGPLLDELGLKRVVEAALEGTDAEKKKVMTASWPSR